MICARLRDLVWGKTGRTGSTVRPLRMTSVGNQRLPWTKESGRWLTGDANTSINCKACRRPTRFTRSGSNHERDERAAVPQHGRAGGCFWSRVIGLDDELRLERRPEATDLYAFTL